MSSPAHYTCRFLPAAAALAACLLLTFASTPVHAQVVSTGVLYHIDVTNLNSYDPNESTTTLFDLSGNGGHFTINDTPTLQGTAGQSDARLYWSGNPGSGARLTGNSTVASLTNLDTALFVTEVFYDATIDWPAGNAMAKGGDNFSENMAVVLNLRPGTNQRTFNMTSWRSAAGGGPVGVNALSSNTTDFLMRAGGMIDQTTGAGGSATVGAWDFSSSVNHFSSGTIDFTANEDTDYPVNALRLKNSTVTYGGDATDFSFAVARFYNLQDVYDDPDLDITNAHQLLQRNYNAEAFRFGQTGVITGQALGSWMSYGQLNPTDVGPLGFRMTAADNATDHLRIAQQGNGATLISGEAGLEDLLRADILWTLSETGDVTADLRFYYDEIAALTGYNPTDFLVLRRDDALSDWTVVGSTLDISGGWLLVSDVSSFSQWSVALIPEPSSMALLLLAGGLLISRHHRAGRHAHG